MHFMSSNTLHFNKCICLASEIVLNGKSTSIDQVLPQLYGEIETSI